jgi:hypothetical protein
MRPTKYDKATLEPLVKSSRSLSEVIRKLGITPNGGNHRHISARIRHANLDTSHFEFRSIRQRIAVIPRKTLKKVVRASTSVRQVTETFGFPPDGRAAHEMRERIADLGLDTSHFLGAGWSRGATQLTDPRVHSIARKVRLPDSDVFIENSHYTKGKQIVRRLLDRGLLYQCAECGIAEWQGIPLVLHLDHINGIHNDNRLENLRLLCPNCHSQTTTYCRRRT